MAPGCAYDKAETSVSDLIVGPVTRVEGLAKPIEGPAEVCEGVRLIPTPGHTPGHCSVLIESAGESAMITGDFIHHPIQFNDPALVSPFDVDNDTR